MPLLHGGGRVAGTYRVILVSHGGAEERHDAVAHDLIDGALVAVHRPHHAHALEDRVEELPGVLRVAGREQLEGALHVGGEHGHPLALSLERVPGAQDRLGQVARRVALGRGEGRLGGARRRDRPAALVAVVAPRQIGVPARRADHLESPAAAAAEPSRPEDCRAGTGGRSRRPLALPTQPARPPPVHAQDARCEPVCPSITAAANAQLS